MVVKFADTPSQKENRQRTHTMPGPPPPHMHHSPMHLPPSSHHGPGQHRPPGGPLPGGPGSIYGHATAPPARPQVGGAPGGGGAMAGLQNLLAPTMAQVSLYLACLLSDCLLACRGETYVPEACPQLCQDVSCCPALSFRTRLRLAHIYTADEIRTNHLEVCKHPYSPCHLHLHAKLAK